MTAEINIFPNRGFFWKYWKGQSLALTNKSIALNEIKNIYQYIIYKNIIGVFIWKAEMAHSLIRGVLIQSWPAGAKKIHQLCILSSTIQWCYPKFWKFDFWLYKIGYFDDNRHRQIGVKMAQRISIFWITPLNCGWQNT